MELPWHKFCPFPAGFTTRHHVYASQIFDNIIFWGRNWFFGKGLNSFLIKDLPPTCLVFPLTHLLLHCHFARVNILKISDQRAKQAHSMTQPSSTSLHLKVHNFLFPFSPPPSPTLPISSWRRGTGLAAERSRRRRWAAKLLFCPQSPILSPRRQLWRECALCGRWPACKPGWCTSPTAPPSPSPPPPTCRPAPQPRPASPTSAPLPSWPPRHRLPPPTPTTRSRPCLSRGN